MTTLRLLIALRRRRFIAPSVGQTNRARAGLGVAAALFTATLVLSYTVLQVTPAKLLPDFAAAAPAPSGLGSLIGDPGPSTAFPPTPTPHRTSHHHRPANVAAPPPRATPATTATTAVPAVSVAPATSTPAATPAVQQTPSQATPGSAPVGPFHPAPGASNPQPASHPDPAPGPRPGPKAAPRERDHGPAAVLLTPVVHHVVHAVDHLTGGATTPVTAPVSGVVDAAAATVDGLVGPLPTARR